MPGIFDILAAQGLLSVFNQPSGNRPAMANATDTGDETSRLLRRSAPGVRQPANTPMAAAMSQQAPAMTGPSTPVPTPALTQVTAANGSFDMPDVALAIQQANQGPVVPTDDPYASSPLAQQAALDTAMRNEAALREASSADTTPTWVRALEAAGRGLTIAGSQDPLKAFTQISELDKADRASRKPKVTPLADGAFSMITMPDGSVRYVKNDEVAQYLGEQQQAKFQRDIQKAVAVAQAGVAASTQKAADKALVDSAGDAATTDLNVKELTRIQQSLANTDTASGPLVGNLPKFLRDTFFPEGTSLQDSAERIIQSSLRQTLGAQFTEKEGSAFLARAYNPRVSEAENARRLGVVIEEIKGIQNNKEAALSYMRQNGTLQGFVPPATSAAPAPASSGGMSVPGLSPNASKYFK